MSLQALQEKAPELVERLNKNVGFGMGLEFREGEQPADLGFSTVIFGFRGSIRGSSSSSGMGLEFRDCEQPAATAAAAVTAAATPVAC
jgi:hypothetical protein